MAKTRATARRVRARLRWRHKLLLIGFGLLISVMVIDAAARTFHLIPRPGNADYRAISRRVGAMLPPYDRFVARGTTPGNREFEIEIRLNALGLRGPDIDRTPPENAIRIVAFGDSFTAGWQIPLEERWTARLADHLSTGDQRVDVMNLGSPGFGTDREYLLYQAYGRELEADLVLLALYVENDVDDNAIALWMPESQIAQKRSFFTLDESGAPVEHPWDYVDETRPYQYQPFPQNVVGWLNAHSFTYRAMRDGIRDAWEGVSDGGEADAPDDDVAPRRPVNRDTLPPSLQIFFTEPDDTWQTAWRLIEALLATFRDAVEADGAQLVVVIVPPHMIVQRDTWQYEDVLAQAGPDWDLWSPQRRMRALLDRLDIPVINPTDLFIDFREQTGRDPFFALDRHFNRTGTCLFGAALANELTTRGFVTAPPGIPIDPLAACSSN